MCIRDRYGDGRAEFLDFGTLDQNGSVTNLLLKGEMFSIRERIRFHAALEAPIFTYTIRDKKGTDLSGTNTLFEGSEVHSVKEGDCYEVEFRQKMSCLLYTSMHGGGDGAKRPASHGDLQGTGRLRGLL